MKILYSNEPLKENLKWGLKACDILLMRNMHFHYENGGASSEILNA